MLILSRKKREGIVIDSVITVTVLKIKGSRITIGIDAPEGYRIVRAELTQPPLSSDDNDVSGAPAPVS